MLLHGQVKAINRLLAYAVIPRHLPYLSRLSQHSVQMASSQWPGAVHAVLNNCAVWYTARVYRAVLCCQHVAVAVEWSCTACIAL